MLDPTSSHVYNENKKHVILIKHFSIKMEIEHGGYHDLQRLRFKIDILPLLVLAIIQTFKVVSSNLFLIKPQNI